MPKEAKIWQSMKESKAILEQTRNEIEARWKTIKSMTPPCPLDNFAGKFCETVGTGMTGRVAFKYKCPKRHVFGWDFDTNEGYPISG